MHEHPAPAGVRVEHADGTVTPVGVTYLRQDEHGIRLWQCRLTMPLTHGDQVRCEVLPARTSLTVVYPRTALAFPNPRGAK